MASTLDQTLEIIARIDRAVTPEEICDGLTSFTARFGLGSMIAGTMPSPTDRRRQQEQHLLLSGFPDGWMDRYLSQNYVHIDPVIRRIQSDLAPFEWSQALPYISSRTASVAHRMFGEAREHRLATGFAVPLITPDGAIAAISFGGERLELPPEAPGMISMIGSYAIGRAIELRSREARRRDAGLTPREIECLKWAADGKTEWEISVILTISEHTADKHLANAQRKLRAANRAQAIANAMRLGLIL
ncbi:LuxR family transcriptional regulator [Stappia sp. F7233]|uniref:LuxR family transcriptional regulator n=1 Tax=Stappia albiluteola TaxID=2758565 RepID=A0A839AJQ3_9HYPH|nr:LuxR family transcriptional regulator [Stappia albiluteola]MBA5778997.1 LuxR family transcriptional regulator [Stappia albiluteola]